MNNKIEGLFCLLFGIPFLFFNKRMASFIIESQNKFWGFHFGEEQIKISRFVCIIVGAGFVIVGILALLNIIDFR